MFKVIKNDNTIELIDKIKYVCKQKNGVIIQCEKENAQGIISKDNSQIYSFKDTPLSNNYEVVNIEELNDLDYIIQQQTDIELAIAELYETIQGGTN